jgi:hypothetical protein
MAAIIVCLHRPISVWSRPLELRDRIATGDLSESDSLALVRSITASIALERFEEIKAVFQSFVQPGVFPLLVHCTFGKDRTGIAVAMLLFALGVPEETVYADYYLLWPMLFRGLTHPFDKARYWMNDIVIFGVALQLDLTPRLLILQPGPGTSQSAGRAMPNPFDLGTWLDRPKWFALPSSCVATGGRGRIVPLVNRGAVDESCTDTMCRNRSRPD